MKILCCIPTLEGGGAERQLSYVAVELTRMGHEVHVASSRGGANLDRLRAGGVVWHRMSGRGNHDPGIFFRLVGLIRELRPDVVQTTLTQMDVLGGGAALLTRTPWVLRESSSAVSYSGGWKNRLRAALGRRADAIVSNSMGGLAYWRSAGERRLHVVPNGIPFEEIVETPPGSVVELGIDPAGKLVLFGGRMVESKNVESLIAALARIADEVPFAAVLCGDGQRRPALERLAGELGVRHRVRFPGYVSNLWSLMKRADAFVSLSRYEGCPNVVMEAMACGCPLVVSDIPAHREILDDRSAVFVDPDEPAVVAEALRATLCRVTAAQARAREARTRAAGWSVHATARLYERLYLSLCDGVRGANGS